jgi:hypothetical protein
MNAGWTPDVGYPDAPTATAIARKFSMYRTAVMPPNASTTQVRECDMAFHAGAEAMFDLLTTEAPDDEEKAMQFLASLKNELLARAQRYVSSGT